MNFEEAKYILDYFPRLMTDKESNANKNYFFSQKYLDSKSSKNYEFKIENIKKLNNITDDEESLQLLINGYEEFAINTAKRIKKQNLNDYFLNRCNSCNSITRTPYARQCKNCGNKWHEIVRGEFKFKQSFIISNSHLYWMVGTLKKGEFRVGDYIDLTNFQLNIISKIEAIEFMLKDQIDYPSLGINISSKQKKLIEKYLNPSAKNIMILKEKPYGS